MVLGFNSQEKRINENLTAIAQLKLKISLWLFPNSNLSFTNQQLPSGITN
jgi:hypothetical protein